ncbi:MAG: acyltransferase [Clostridia bacterium]|nr:acyltransferase [Clostridium sp.]
MEKVKTSKDRQMNFELLRIISMIFILLHHYSLKGGLLSIENITTNKFIGEFIYIGGKVGVVIFILISGYFLIDKKYKFKNLFKVILEVFFYSILIHITLLLANQIQFSFKNLIKSIFPILYNQYWFATSYVGLYIFIPYINKLIYGMSKEQYKILIIFGTILFVILPTIIIGGGDSFIGGISYFIYLYLVAGYLKKYNVKFLDTNKRCIFILILMITIMMGVSIISTYLSINIESFEKGITYLANQNSITVVLLGLSIFQLFRNINIKYNKLIEICAKSSFAVYLIHDNVYLSKILWKNIFKTQNYYNENTFVLIFHIIITTIIIYAVTLLIEYFRQNVIEKRFFEKIYMRFIKSKVEKVEKILNS